MKTRIINTDIFRDENFQNLDDKETRIILFILANDQLGLLPVWKPNISEVAFFCGTTKDKILSTLEKSQSFGIHFLSDLGWIIFEEKFSYFNYKGGKTQNAKRKEWESLPSDIQKLVDVDGNIDQLLGNHCSSIEHINHKSEIINNKSEIKNQKTEENISPKIQNTFEESLGVELSKSKANVSAEKTLKNKMLKMFPDKDPEEMLCYVIQGVRALNEETPDTQYVIESLNSLNNKLPKILIRLQNRKKQFNNNKPL
jgi:hypothetical protein